jgi:hypothetical protein
MLVVFILSLVIAASCSQTGDDGAQKDVYAGGYSRNSLSVPVPGYWKNGDWIGLTPLDVSKDSIVYSLVVSNGDVYAGGYSTNSSDVQVPGYWKNGEWIGLTPLDVSKDSGVRLLFIY